VVARGSPHRIEQAGHVSFAHLAPGRLFEPVLRRPTHDAGDGALGFGVRHHRRHAVHRSRIDADLLGDGLDLVE